MFRQRLADRLASQAGFGRDGGVGFGGRVGRIGAGILGGDVFLEFADQQFELFDVVIKLFRRAAEPCAAQHSQLHLQLFNVQRLGVDFGGVGGEFDVLAREFGVLVRQLGLQVCGESAQCLRVGRERLVRQGHAKTLLRELSACQVSLSNDIAFCQTATGLRGNSAATVLRQSIASTRSASCAGVNTMPPSTIGGQMNFPLSNRLANMHRPVPS